MQFLYMGFSQEVNVRRYRFQGVVPRERPTKAARNLEFSLTADMALLARYQVRLQDGPSLCLQILTAALTATEDDAIQPASFAITGEDLCAFVNRRKAIDETKLARRKRRAPFKPAPSSQLRWPQVK